MPSSAWAECSGVYETPLLNLPYGHLKRTCTDPKKTLNAAIIVGLQMIDAQLAAFLQEGVGIHIGTRDEARRPNGARAIAVHVEPGGAHLVVYVAAAVLSYFFPLYTPLFFMGASAITVALQFLLPPSFPKIKSQEGATVSPSIAGVRNEARPFGVVPRIMGRHRTFPPANPRYATRFHSVAA